MIIAPAKAQDVDGLLNLIQAGQLDSAKLQLADLSFKYPGNPGIRYARALMQTDALVAAGLYKDIIRNHGSSRYTPGALMHLGEYYYAQGLYVQSRQYLSRLIRFHPAYPDLVNAVNLSLRAGIASRQMDSVYIDLQDILQNFPNVAFDIPEELDLTRLAGNPVQNSPSSPPSSTKMKPIRGLGQTPPGESGHLNSAYILQAGAFGNYDNARRLADQIESIGYAVHIQEQFRGGRKLYLIQVGQYPTRTAAMSAADMLEAALGVSAFPVANN